MLTAHSRLVLSLSIVLCSSAGVARAEKPTSHSRAKALPAAAQAEAEPTPPTNDPLYRARKSLERYDLEGDATFAELKALAAVATSDTEPARALEARFLRAAAAADLLVVATKLDRPMLRDSLASALGYAPTTLVASVKAELQAAAIAHYKAPAQNALAMIEHIESNASAPMIGVLRDFIAVETAARAAVTSDPNGALATLSDDPCKKRDGAKVADQCALSSFDASSRRSLAALSNAAGSNASLQSAALKGDPLAHALANLSAERASTLERVSVCVLPDLDQTARSEATTQANAQAKTTLPKTLRSMPGKSTLTVRITASEARSIVAPCLGLSSDGAAKPEELELAWSTLALPETYRPYIQPIAGLSESLAAEIDGAALTRIVVMPDANVQAHVLARALIALPAVDGGASVSLLTRKANGDIHASPIEIARTEIGTAAVHVRVRLGGYSLYLGDHFEDIPRVKTERGFQFDRSALEQRLSSAQPGAARISFMPDVASHEVLAALSSAAERAGRVQIMIP
jgi:hypothetical protein